MSEATICPQCGGRHYELCTQREEAARDPWQWLHDNGFSWDDVNAIAAILGHVGLDILPEQEPKS